MAYKDKREQIRKQNEYAAKAYDRIALNVKRGKKDTLLSIATKHNQNLTEYIVQAINERIERDKDVWE